MGEKSADTNLMEFTNFEVKNKRQVDVLHTDIAISGVPQGSQ